MIFMMILLAVIGGAMLSIQDAINGQLGSKVGVLKSAFLTFSVGALITGLLIFFFEPKHATNLLDVPKWQLLGAMFGVPYFCFAKRPTMLACCCITKTHASHTNAGNIQVTVTESDIVQRGTSEEELH